MSEKPENKELWKVVINIEDQYSIWPIRKEILFGWKDTGTSSTKIGRPSFIKKVLTDMRPKNLRELSA